jgi:hypothetical protein
MSTKSIQVVLTTFITFILLSSIVLAPPGIPHRFYGSVTINGNPAPDGTTVVAKINGVEVASTTTKDGKYGYNPIFYVDDPDNDRSGKEIRFFVNGVDTGKTEYFCNGCSTRLDLTIAGTTTTQPSTGGSYTPPQTTTTTQPPTNQTTTTTTTTTSICQERWVCTDWSPCVNKSQTRTCTDENNCGTDLNKPFESQPCSPTEGGSQPTGGTVSPITGFFVALTGNPLYYIGIILVIAIIAIVLFKKKSPLKKIR